MHSFAQARLLLLTCPFAQPCLPASETFACHHLWEQQTLAPRGQPARQQLRPQCLAGGCHGTALASQSCPFPMVHAASTRTSLQTQASHGCLGLHAASVTH